MNEARRRQKALAEVERVLARQPDDASPRAYAGCMAGLGWRVRELAR